MAPYNFWNNFEDLFNGFGKEAFNSFLRRNKQYYEDIVISNLILEPELFSSEFNSYNMKDVFFLLNLENRLSLMKDISLAYSRIKEISIERRMNYYPVDVFQKFKTLYEAYYELKNNKNHLDSEIEKLISSVNNNPLYSLDINELFILFETNSRYSDRLNSLYQGYTNIKNQLEKWINIYTLLMDRDILKEFLESGKQWKEEVKSRANYESPTPNESIFREFKEMHSNLEKSYRALRNLEMKEKYSKIYSLFKEAINSNSFPPEMLFLLKNGIIKNKLEKNQQYSTYYR
ncbi:MAG: hypothetical protein QXR30_02820 [Candidatus Woesearchaeota archaeon]